MTIPLIRRRKKLARALLYGGPLVVVAVTLLAIRYFEDLGFKDWTKTDWLALEEVRLLQQYIQIDTSHPDGNDLAGAEFLARILEENGIPATIERLGERQAGLYATLPGDDPRALVLHHHIDVETVEEEKAKYPPFSGTIEPPFIYGRGAFDMKSYGVAQLMAMLDLKRKNRHLERSLTMLATSDEERGGELGVKYLLAEHPEWKRQFWGVLTEGGAIEARDINQARYWGTEFGQRMLVLIEVCDSHRERLEDLAEDLAGVSRVRRVLPELMPFFKIYGATRDRAATRELLQDPEHLLARIASYKKDIGVTELPPYVEAMLTDELSNSPVYRSENGDQGWEMTLVLWLQPGRTLDQFWQERIGHRLDGFNYEVVQPYEKAVLSPIDHPLFTTLDAYMKKRYPEVPHGPLFIPWAASESRYFRLAGIPSYGFTPFWILSGDGGSMKGPDERLPLPAFVEGTEVYTELVARLVGAD